MFNSTDENDRSLQRLKMKSEQRCLFTDLHIINAGVTWWVTVK